VSRVANCLDWLTSRIPAPLSTTATEAEESSGGVEIDTLLMALVSLLTLSAFLLLYIFRALDDNSLVSWQWAFVGVDVRPLLLALAVAIAASLALSGVRVPVRLQAAALFGGSFLAAAMLWPIPEVNVDAARYFVQAKSLELHGVGYFLQHWGSEIPAWTDLPLVPFIYGLVFGILGEQRIAIQVVSTSFFCGTVLLTYLIGRTLWNARIGAYAAVLLLAMPYLLTQVPLMLVDVPTMFFLTLAVFTTIKAVRCGGGWLMAAAVAITMAALCKYTNWLMLSVVPVIFLTHLDGGTRSTARRAGAVCLALGLLVGAVVLWKGEVLAGQIALLLSYQVPALGGWSESLISTFLFQTHPFVAAAALWSLYLAVKRRDLKFAVVAWLLVLVVAFEAPRIRYILMIFPMLALMAAYGLEGLGNARLGRHLVACTAAAMLVTAIFVYLPFLQGTSARNIQKAGAYLDSIAAQQVDVFVQPQPGSIVNPAVSVPLLDLFTDKRVVLRSWGTAPADPKSLETSPLRFTWELPAPRFLTSGANTPTSAAAVAVLSGRRGQALPDVVARRIAGYRLTREFAQSDRAFRYQTLVRIYEPQ